jgi:hypothetical protein
MPKAPLYRFIRCLERAKEFPHLDQVGWLLTHWSFDDTAAYYQPMPQFFANLRNQLMKDSAASVITSGRWSAAPPPGV